MKRVLLTLLVVVMGLQAFSQSPSRNITLRPAYPVAIGNTTTDSFQCTHSGLDLCDIIQDSLPVYEIGHIFDQTVQYTESGHGFYIKADSLHAHHVTYSCEVMDTLLRGPIEFNPNTGRFKYYPLSTDYQSFLVIFCATNGIDSVSETVRFDLMPQVVSEVYAFRTTGTMPSSEDYTLVAETIYDSIFFNTAIRNTYSYSISGKEIVFDNDVQNKVWGLSGREDIHDLSIFAERIVVRSDLLFPQTNVTIYAKELVFEDSGSTNSCINTTPTHQSILADSSQSQDGANAGNITLYIKELKGNPAKRFILNGAHGQSTNRNGTPGNGGNGGVLTSSIDVRDYCDFARGSCGLKYTVDTNSCNNLGSIIASGAIGQEGYFVLVNTPYGYLHPFWMSACVLHLNDAFINDFNEYSTNKCHEYKEMIEQYIELVTVDSCDTEEEVQLKNSLAEVENMLFKLDEGLDYFGNPVGWTPLLSFEVMLSTFNNEIDRAIPTLYMYYWLNRIDQSLAKWVEVKMIAASQTEEELQSNIALINSFVSEVPVLQDKAEEISELTEVLLQKMEALRDRLMSKAKHNVKKRNRIKKAFSITKAIVNCIPVYGQAISTGIDVVASSGVLNRLIGEDIDYSAALNAIGNNTMDPNFMANLQNAWNAAGNAIGGNFSGLKSSFSALSKSMTPLIKNFSNLNEVLKHASTPTSEVEVEFNKLKASSAEWASLESELNVLNKKKDELVISINQLFSNMTSTMSDISNDIVALDAFRRDAFTGNSKRDLNAMQNVEKMEQRAKNRLMKYYYYLRKAYEYRLLRPYEGEFNLNGLFGRLESVGLAMDSIVNPEVYRTLSSIYTDVVSGVVEDIVDEYSNNYPEQSAPITIVISREQLDALNAGYDTILNFYEMGVFSPDEENVRIVNLGVQHIETHVDGNIGYTGYMDLNMTHSGISKFRKDGQMYWFDHRSRTTSTPHTWGIRYDAISQETTNIQPSAASASLLSSLINSSGNIMLFSRPSAWGDISLSKKVHTSGAANIIIDSLVLRLQYDFVRRPNRLRNIDITTNDGLLPYINCSEADVCGRSNGLGNLNRSYMASNSPVTFTAIEQYGTYHFLNWTDRAGNIVSDSTALTVRRTTDQFYRANYERRVPILEVPDTIKVPHGGGMVTVQVRNVGSGEIEMDWEVDDSISTWVHLNGVAEGIDDGVFTFFCDTNYSQERRIDSLEIFAPETDEMVKMIYVVQVDSAELAIRPAERPVAKEIAVYPNPTNSSVTIEGDDIRWVTVYSTVGRKMLVVRLNGDDHCTFGLDELPDGIYILDVTTGKGTTRQKVVKTTR